MQENGEELLRYFIQNDPKICSTIEIKRWVKEVIS